jgi:uncharacterized protein (DUF488 family)
MDEFTELLASQAVTQLVDVRSAPYSRFYPQFNRKSLQQYLTSSGLHYIYLGEALGGRPKDPACYKHHLVPARVTDIPAEIDYQTVMQRPWFIEGIWELLGIAKQQPTCILCSEKDPADCHRQLLIASYLLENYPEVLIWHILADGNLVDARTMKKLGVAENR